MKIVSWNVAGFRACLNKGFNDFFNEIDADIFCLQEVKAEKSQINFSPNNYYEFLYPAEKKGYSGTLVYSKIKPISVSYGIGIDDYDREGRLITLEFDNFYLINSYVPNVKRDLSRMEYRMKWEERLLDYVNNLKTKKSVIICGDFNVAHQEIDIKNAKANIGNAGFTFEEREKFTILLSNGFIDTFRYKYPSITDKYTWWSYMKGVRERNIGWRIDYFVISNDFKDNLLDAYIYSNVYGSDHCPIGIDIKK